MYTTQAHGSLIKMHRQQAPKAQASRHMYTTQAHGNLIELHWQRAVKAKANPLMYTTQAHGKINLHWRAPKAQASPLMYTTQAHGSLIELHRRERSGSVVECLTRDRRAAGSSLTGVTALWSLSKTHLS